MSNVLLREIRLYCEKLFLSAVEIIFVSVPVYDFFSDGWDWHCSKGCDYVQLKCSVNMQIIDTLLASATFLYT